MPTLTVDGQNVTVDDSFTKLSPDQQHAAVDEIAKSLPAQNASSNPMSDPYYAAAKADYDKLIAKGYPAPGTSRLLGQGLTLNSADEILAGLSTPIEMAKAGNLNVGEAYKRAKAFQDVIVDEARKNSGALGTGAEIAGGLASGAGLAGAGLTTARALAPNAGLLARTASSAADAGIYGGVAGGMEGNSLAERGGNAAKGAALGAGLGAAVPVGLAGARFAASPVLSNISARINPEGFGNTQVARALIESGQTPQDIGAAITQAAREGQPMFTPADAMGNAGQRMLSTVARAPGEGRTDVVNFLEQRQAGQGRRVAGQLAEGFDSPQTAAQVGERMTRTRDAVADAEYGGARQNAGPVDVSPVVANIDATLTPGANQIARPQSGIRNDTIESALQGIRERLTDNRSMLTDFTALQRVRGDVADQVQQAVSRQQGNRARLLGGVLRTLDAQMEAASPGFAQANRNFEAASRNIDAIGEGRTAATRGRTQDTIPAFQGLPPRGQEAFRAGYVDPHIEQTQGAAFGANKARPLLNDAFQAESNAMAPGAAQMQRQLGRENTMFETRAHALGGSRTADNLADASAMGVDPAMIGHVLQGNWMGALRSAMGGISNGLTGNTAAVRQQVGNILLNRNLPPAAFERILRETVERITRIQGAARLAGRG
ncbi:MAG TPA: hypothetical protein VK620_02780, partial [Bradyrhizobium sp.]|nr:hypothetical protein [Bradyrhizobium sp.]